MSQAPRKMIPARTSYATDQIESRLKSEIERDREEEKELKFALEEERKGALFDLESSITSARKIINSDRAGVEDIRRLTEHIRAFTSKASEDFPKNNRGGNAAQRLKTKNMLKQLRREKGLERIPEIMPFEKPTYIMLLKFYENETMPLRALHQPPYLRTTMQKLKPKSLVMQKFTRHLAVNTLGLMPHLARHCCYDPAAVKEEIYAGKKFMTNVTLYLWSVIGDDDMVKHLNFGQEEVLKLRILGQDRFWEMLKVWIDWMNSGDGMGMIDNTPRVFVRSLDKKLKADLGTFIAALKITGPFIYAVLTAIGDVEYEGDNEGQSNQEESALGRTVLKSKSGALTNVSGVVRKVEIGAVDSRSSAAKTAVCVSQ